jgi:transposase
MEATGYCHYRLAQYLHKNGILVSVVNPLSVKRFIQMKLVKVKTDKSDAKAICEYGEMNDVPLYRDPKRMSAIVQVIGQLLETSHSDQEQASWRRDLGHPVKVCVWFPKTTVKTFEQGDRRP